MQKTIETKGLRGARESVFDPYSEFVAKQDTFGASQYPPYDPNGAMRHTCKYPRDQYLTGGLLQNNGFPVRVACGQCSNCQKTKLEDLQGRIGAQALICAEIYMFTGTFDDWHSPEAMAWALKRDPRPTQLMMKALRRQENYNLCKYNISEAQKAAKEHREPRLVDTTQSYIKAFWVYEKGDEKGRGHWHALVFLESHFDIPDEVLRTGDLTETQKYVKRVWNPETTVGFHKGLPPEANDPMVISMRTRSIQKWHHWPSGWCNFKSAMRYADEGDGTRLKTATDLVRSLRYLNQYLKKGTGYGDDWYSDHKGNSEPLPQGSGASRTSSRGIGSDFAMAVARGHAALGPKVAENNLVYCLKQHTFKRSAQSTAKRVANMRGQKASLSPAGGLTLKGWSSGRYAAYNDAELATMVDSRKRFRMKGAMADAYCREFMRARAQKYGWDKVLKNLDSLGDPVLRWYYRHIRNSFNEWLKSQDCEAKRSAVAARNKREGSELFLPDRLTPIPPYRFTSDGLPSDGSYRAGRRVSLYKVPISERVQLTRSEVKEYREMYSEITPAFIASTFEGTRLSDLDSWYWSKSLEKLLTETQRRKNKIEYETKKRRDDEEETRIALASIIERSQNEKDDDRLRHMIAATDVIEEIHASTAVRMPNLCRHDVGAVDVSTDQMREWLNHSDDYHWPERRDELVKRFFTLVSEGEGWRCIKSPKGDVYIQRRALSRREVKRNIMIDGKFRKASLNTVWATRMAQTDEEKQKAQAGTLSLKNAEQRDALLVGLEPLKTVSFKLNATQDSGAIPREILDRIEELVD